MKEIRCPFCSGESINFVDDVKVDSSNLARPLMGCQDCEKFYWDDNGKEVKGLKNLCETLMFMPFKCNEKVRYPLSSGYSTYPSYKELDKICCECPQRQFLLKDGKYKF